VDVPVGRPGPKGAKNDRPSMGDPPRKRAYLSSKHVAAVFHQVRPAPWRSMAVDTVFARAGVNAYNLQGRTCCCSATGGCRSAPGLFKQARTLAKISAANRRHSSPCPGQPGAAPTSAAGRFKAGGSRRPPSSSVMGGQGVVVMYACGTSSRYSPAGLPARAKTRYARRRGNTADAAAAPPKEGGRFSRHVAVSYPMPRNLGGCHVEEAGLPFRAGRLHPGNIFESGRCGGVERGAARTHLPRTGSSARPFSGRLIQLGLF